MRSASIPSIAALAAALVAIILAVVALADGDGGGSTADLEQRVQEIESAHAGMESGITIAQITAAMGILDGTGFHEIDEDMQVAGEIPAGLDGDVRIARQVAAAFAWPSELQEHVDTLVTHLEAFEAAIADDDLQATKTESGQSHAAWHALHEAAYPFLAGEQPSDGGDHEPGAGHGG